jgi:hypothetical protein
VTKEILKSPQLLAKAQIIKGFKAMLFAAPSKKTKTSKKSLAAPNLNHP